MIALLIIIVSRNFNEYHSEKLKEERMAKLQEKKKSLEQLNMRDKMNGKKKIMNVSYADEKE